MGNDPDNNVSWLVATALGFTYIYLQKYFHFTNLLLPSWKLLLLLFLGIVFLLSIFKIKSKSLRENKDLDIYKGKEDSTFCGFEAKTKNTVFVTTSQRSMHTQVIGTTNAGKTESVILPWALQDIKNGGGLIIIDGKSDRGLLNKLWAYSNKYSRSEDFRLFSLGHLEESSQYNPLIGKTPEEVIERVFSAFEFENSYYKNIQFEVFANLIRVFFKTSEIITFKRIYQALNDKNYLRDLIHQCNDDDLKNWATGFLALTPTDREQRISGLKASISHFAQGETSTLFDTLTPSIDIDQALNENKILYFQLPVLLSPFLGRATGKMLLQNIQNAVANRHRADNRKPKFFSIFLDDFTEYLYPGFVSILNKSRSANIGLVFAHQALGDIKTLGDSVANSILTNSNLKVFMRGNDPESAEYFSKLIGTKKTLKLTERRKKTLLNEQSTGDQSAREVDEFIIHPNKFKNELGTGQAIMVLPMSYGAKIIELKFQMFPDLSCSEKIIAEKSFPTAKTESAQKQKPTTKPLIENTEVLCT
ncbi:MAG: TraM recognition domain-containing protein [Bdellovibrionaceae bacterium]|nr:TraM recognition domain-containing protein [Pseudobdellovibrionaceae bacterium]